MKILYIIDSLNSGGKERQLVELLKFLKSKECIKYKLIVLSDKIEYDYINNFNIDIVILKRRYKKDISIFKKIYKICLDFKPDIIHSWEFMCTMYSLPIAKLFKIKFINGSIRNAPSKIDIFNIKYLLNKISFLFSDFIVSNSNAGLKSYNPPKHKSFCVHNGFDFNRLKNIKDIMKVKKQFNITTNNIIGMVARFDKKKDYKSYVQAAINILNKRDDVTFIAVGDGNTLNYCKNLVPKSYKNNILFLGKQKNVENIINILDVGVLATYTEGISNTIMEYMAFAKPVVTTINNGNKEIIRNKLVGYLVETGNVLELTEKIEHLLDNKNIAIKLGKAGKKHLEDNFTINKMVESYIQIYKKCV